MNLGGKEKPQRKKKKRRGNDQTENESNVSSPKQDYNKQKLFESKVIEIPQRKIGLIVGKAGSTIKEIWNKTHCEVILPKQTSTNDNENDDGTKNLNKLIQITLRGTPEELRDGLDEVNFLIENGRLKLDSERGIKTNKEKETAIVMNVPSKVCGMLIGGEGVKINELQDKTGADIWVDWDTTTHKEAGVSKVTLKGTRQSVNYAKKEIKSIIKMFGGAGGKKASGCRFELPSYCTKLLFKDKGKHLKELQKEYNVSIDVKHFRETQNYYELKDKENQKTVMIIIVGDEEDAEDCKYALNDLVGIHLTCKGCKRILSTNQGSFDDSDFKNDIWYCFRCWDQYNGIDITTDEYKEKEKKKYFENLDELFASLDMETNSMKQEKTNKPEKNQVPHPPKQFNDFQQNNFQENQYQNMPPPQVVYQNVPPPQNAKRKVGGHHMYQIEKPQVEQNPYGGYPPPQQYNNRRPPKKHYNKNGPSKPPMAHHAW